jgi:uncharacterized protein (DUF362 family)/Pyruvate/2-oxoacid:ferredoxin oxidoreductase delta subunit
MTQVAIIKCASYHPPEVEQALKAALSALGGLSQFIKPGQKVLIKPNVLMGKAPDNAVTTNPAIISAVIKEVVKAGGIALVGDSPGDTHSNVIQTMEITGIKPAVENAGGKMVYFQHEGVIQVKSPSHNKMMPVLTLAKIIETVDVIINLPKLKTHNLTGYTGAIKNMFGTVPGFNKTKFHNQLHEVKDFSAALVDILEITKPALNVMDAVIGMEGPGPSNGQPRKMGAIIASTDAVALDTIASYLIGYDPKQIETTATAYKRGLGEMDLAKIKVLGARLEELRQADWKRALNLYSFLQGRLPGLFYRLLFPLVNQLKIYPVIDQKKCTKCLVCYNSCPVKTINYDKKQKIVEINHQGCINCFCCHELCEYHAIWLKRSWLAKLLNL